MKVAQQPLPNWPLIPWSPASDEFVNVERDSTGDPNEHIN
jgi:hypothetical protein